MTKRITWLVVSGLMVLSLVLVSCAPKVTEEKKEVVTEKKEVVTEKKEVVTEKKEVTEKEGVEMVVDALGRSVPKPQYGGVMNLAEAADPDTGFSRSGLLAEGASDGWLYMSNEGLVMQDRLKGPAGTAEWEGIYSFPNYPAWFTGRLAESWEIIQPDTLKFKIRKGIHWQDKAPVYGAEMTAEDVVYSWMVRFTRARTFYARRAYLSNMAKPGESIYVSPDDSSVVVFKAAPGQLAELWGYASHWIEPKAMGAIEGEGFVDWRGVVGTGPFLLTDYVSGSSLTWQRNPNYWVKDQLHPENQLPYLSGVKLFIIPDPSTQQAALRTGKLDMLPKVQAEEAKSLIKTNPELLWLEKLGSAPVMFMRVDVPPFNDIRVRQAMMMAIDHDELVSYLYEGVPKYYFPAYPITEHKDAFVPLEEMPQVVQEMFGYHPDKAKKLLAEAGYPNGFTTSVMADGSAQERIELAAVVAAYWAKIGVTLKIDVKEAVTFNAMRNAFNYPQGVITSLMESELQALGAVYSKSARNFARINEPWIDEIYEALRNLDVQFDLAKVAQIQRKAMPRFQEFAPFILLPIMTDYYFWQPWVKGYYGENRVDGVGADARQLLLTKHIWIDQQMKKAMGR